MAQTVPAQLDFSLGNDQAPNTVYISTDPDDNAVAWSIASTVAATLTPGKLVPIDQAGEGAGSLLYLDMTPLGLSQEAFAAIQVTTPGWSAQGYVEESRQMVALTPLEPVTLSAAPVMVALGAFTLAAQPPANPAQLTVTAFRIPPVTTDNDPFLCNLAVFAAYPPHKEDGDLHDAIAASLVPNAVVNSVGMDHRVPNTLRLVLQPGEQPARIVAEKDSAFVLRFVYGAHGSPGFGALLDVEAARELQVAVGPGAADWTITPDCNREAPSWRISPPPGQPILGSGAEASVEIDINGLATFFEPGPALALLAYEGMPGFKDGVYSLGVRKLPHVVIASFSADPPVSVLTDGQASVRLSWNTSHATTLMLQPLCLDVTGKTSTQAIITETTQFTLSAFGQGSDSVDNVAIANVTPEVMPVINTFEAVPSVIAQTDFPAAVTLRWNVDTNSTVTLVSSTGTKGDRLGPAGSIERSVNEPQMLTLVPDGKPAVPPWGLRRLVLSAFSPSVATMDLPAPATAVASPPNANYLAVCLPTLGTVLIYSVTTLATVDTITLDGAPSKLAFSPDGSVLYVANPGSGLIDVVTVKNQPGTKPYVFTPGNPISLPGMESPIALAASQDGSLWVAHTGGVGKPGKVARVTFDATGRPFVKTAAVGTGPSAIVLLPSGGVAYVANTCDNTVSVVTVQPGGELAVGTPIPVLDIPRDLVVTPDGSLLLVACGGANTVLGIRTGFPYNTPRKSFGTKGNPNSLAMFQSGAYAYATTEGVNQLELIDHEAKKPTKASPIPLEDSPRAVSITPDGGLAFVVYAKKPRLSVITLARYGQAGTPVSCNGPMTDVAIGPDSAVAYAWYNAMLAFQAMGTVASPGLNVINLQTETRAVVLAKERLCAVAVSPDKAAGLLFAASLKTSTIDCYDTTDFIRRGSLAVPPWKGTMARQIVNLSLSRDGLTLFALIKDGGLHYSLLVYDASDSAGPFALKADVPVFTAVCDPLLTLAAAAPDGMAAYVADTTAGRLFTVTRKDVDWAVTGPAIDIGLTPTTLAVSPDGGLAYVAVSSPQTNAVVKIDLAASRLLGTVYLPDSAFLEQLNDLVVSPDGTWLFASDGVSAGIRVLDARSLRVVQTMAWREGVALPFGLAVTGDGSRILCANVQSGNVAIAQQVQPA